MRRTLKLGSLAILAGIALFGCAPTKPPLAPAEPVELPPSDISRLARALPSYTRFGISGLAFLDSSLFVATNIGLVRIDDQDAGALFRWYAQFNVITGPWTTPDRSGMWLLREDDGYLIRHDRAGWHRISRPTPPEGFWARADSTVGLAGTGKVAHFRLVGADNAWTWADHGEWTLNPLPPAQRFSGVIGVAEFDNLLLYIMHVGSCGPASCEYEGYWLSGGQWSPAIRLPIKDIKQIATAANAVFVRGAQGQLLRITQQGVSQVDTPGACEAIVRTTSGRLLASFRGTGIYLLDTTWIKILDYPYPPSEGEHHAYLAERDGTVAFATQSVPRLIPGTDDKWYYTGSDALWLSVDGRLRKINLLME